MQSCVGGGTLTSSVELVRVIGDDDIDLSASKHCLPVNRRDVA